MRIRQYLFAGALGLSTIVGSPGDGRAQTPVASNGTEHAMAAPRVALLVTQPGAMHTSLYLAAPGDSKAPVPVATFTHLAGATARGVVVPGTETVIAAADTAETRDASFNASLFRVAPHAPPEVLCDRVVHASRPLVTADGRVFVARGMAGAEPTSARLEDMRVDALAIDEVDPSTGATRTVHSTSGYLTFLAGSYGGEILVYRVGPSGADIVAIEPDSTDVRTVVPSLPPFARDFSVDPVTGTLVWQGRHETDSHRWTIESADLVTGARSRLFESDSMNMVPYVLPGGTVLYSPEGRGGLSVLGGDRAAPLGEGADWVLAISEDQRVLGVLHTVQGALPVPFVIDVESGQTAIVRTPTGTRAAIAGFVSAGGAK